MSSPSSTSIPSTDPGAATSTTTTTTATIMSSTDASTTTGDLTSSSTSTDSSSTSQVSLESTTTTDASTTITTQTTTTTSSSTTATDEPSSIVAPSSSSSTIPSQTTTTSASTSTTTSLASTTSISSVTSTTLSDLSDSSTAESMSSSTTTTTATSSLPPETTSEQPSTTTPVFDSTTEPAVAPATTTSERSTRTSTTMYTLTSSGDLVVVTSVVTTVVGPAIVSTANPSTNRSLNGNAGSGKSFFDNTGAVAGTFVAVGLIAAGIAALLAFCFLRRKKRRQLDEDLRVAAGGAGDGGAGVARFHDGEDDLFEPSEGHHSSSYHQPTMSSYGTVPLAGAAAAYAGNRRSMSGFSSGGGWDPSHSPTQSQHGIGMMGPAAHADYQTHGPGQPNAAAAGAQHGAEGPVAGIWDDAGTDSAKGDASPSGSGSKEGSAEGHGPPGHQYLNPAHNGALTRQSSDSFYPATSYSGGAPRLPALAYLNNTPGRQDDRLEPGMSYPGHDNASQSSFGGDENDYSRKRVLRVANPTE